MDPIFETVGPLGREVLFFWFDLISELLFGISNVGTCILGHSNAQFLFDRYAASIVYLVVQLHLLGDALSLIIPAQPVNSLGHPLAITT